MKRTISQLLLAGLLAVFTGVTFGQSSMITPENYFGYKPGSDGNLFTYSELTGYLQKLSEASPMVKMEQIGKSPMGKPMYIVFISSAENIGKLQEYKKINKALALDPGLDQATREKYVEDGKVFLLATLSMHSTEVGPSTAAPLIAFDLATTDDPEKLNWLDNVVLMMVPNHNPDGMDKVVENYKKYKGTKYEGASLPDVYHKYVGHDNNRDFVTLSQDDSKAIAAIYNKTWFPQVMVEKHQMGSTGVRYFVPPNHDPIAENVPGELFAWSGLFGQNMAKDMTLAGQAGVAQHYIFDDYWPGSTETCIWKNVIGFLTEAASAKVATPVYVEPTELSVGGKGLSEYKKSVNMLVPWEGGWWRLGDIVDYEITSMMSILKTASGHREEILEFRNDLCRQMVEMGKNKPPFYYILPLSQKDKSELVDLVSLMEEHGVEVYSMKKDLVIENMAFQKGDLVIPLAQPFRAFIKEVMEKQQFPERHYTPDGELIKPYDITSWSLPLHRNVKSIEIDKKNIALEGMLTILDGPIDLSKPVPDEATFAILPSVDNGSYKVAFGALSKQVQVDRVMAGGTLDNKPVEAGSFVISLEGKDGEAAREMIEGISFPVTFVNSIDGLKTKPLQMPRIALVETYFHDMDAGWTRFVFDSYGIPFTKIRPHEIGKEGLQKNYDIIIFPDASKDLLMEGKRKSGSEYYMGSYHPDYAKGMGKKGLAELLEFMNNGGKIISWGRSTSLFEGPLSVGEDDEKEAFQLPFRDVSDDLKKKGLYVPGSLLKVSLNTDHPLTWGMPEETGVFSRGRPVFQTSIPGFDMDRRVIAVYPEKDVLMSGYASGEKQIGNKAAMIWVKKGKGQAVLYGFNPQFRASTQGAYKLLFNALLL